MNLEKLNVLIIGNGTSGFSVASLLSSKANVTIISKTKHFSPCAMPYVLDGTFELNSIIKETDFIEDEIVEIDSNTKKVIGKKSSYSYDKLVIATGSSPVIPKIPGLTNYLTLSNPEDLKLIQDKIKPNKSFVIIGAGPTGLEIAHSLSTKDCKVSVIELKHLLPSVLDEDMSNKLLPKLDGIDFYLNDNIREIKNNTIVLSNDSVDFDELILATGVSPKINFKTEIPFNKGFLVDNHLQTTHDSNIYACGDCARTGQALLATNAIKQAEVVATNILETNESNLKSLSKSLNTSITKIGDLEVASTGEKESEHTIQAIHKSKTLPDYHPEDSEIIIKLISKKDGILVGAQLIGKNIVDKIQWIALAIKKEISLQELITAEVAYNPSLSNVFDPVQVCAKKLLFKLK